MSFPIHFPSPSTGALVLSPFRESVPEWSAGWRAVRDKTEGRKGRGEGGRGKERDETKSCVPRVREKEIAIFFSRNGWENLRGAWRPSTRIWRVALVHRAGGTSNHRNLHHLLHSPSPSPPCSRARHPPPNRDSCRRRPVSRYRSSRRRYPRNPHRSPAPRRPRTTQSEMPHVSARSPPLTLLVYNTRTRLLRDVVSQCDLVIPSNRDKNWAWVCVRKVCVQFRGRGQPPSRGRP